MKEFFKKISKIYNNFFHPKCEIMLIMIDTQSKRINCYDWISAPIKQLSGTLTKELWDEIKKYCRKNTHLSKSENKYYGGTRVYVWRGMELKYEYYGEPIETFLENENIILKYIQ